MCKKYYGLGLPPSRMSHTWLTFLLHTLVYPQLHTPNMTNHNAELHPHHLVLQNCIHRSHSTITFIASTYSNSLLSGGSLPLAAPAAFTSYILVTSKGSETFTHRLHHLWSSLHLLIHVHHRGLPLLLHQHPYSFTCRPSNLQILLHC